MAECRRRGRAGPTQRGCRRGARAGSEALRVQAPVRHTARQAREPRPRAVARGGCERGLPTLAGACATAEGRHGRRASRGWSRAGTVGGGPQGRPQTSQGTSHLCNQKHSFPRGRNVEKGRRGGAGPAGCRVRAAAAQARGRLQGPTPVGGGLGSGRAAAPERTRTHGLRNAGPGGRGLCRGTR